MTRRLRFLITAALTVAVTELMVGLAIAAHADVSSRLHLAGISLNALD